MKKAFTMVELLFVMAIIASLTAIAVPKIQQSNQKNLKLDTESTVRNAYIEGSKLKNHLDYETIENGWTTGGSYVYSNTEGGRSYEIFLNGESYKIPLPSPDTQINLKTNYDGSYLCLSIYMRNSSTPPNFYSYGLNECRNFKSPQYLTW
ncbi:MAG: type II secretion system GspH family protein [Sulfuricurvum sp.]|jgi:prepilin-type N-terminal cleavage/methylation domain-containing protein|uniref:type II secretion system protein n=1 Tax=Sulfuricurvum sp. TaxID=2025608 RepID=UPI0025DBDAE9|nr:type II secretion system protein [Sulfuricurvum sp.]MCK9372449.1 type II secretion system GspH family protein [Sulfuricurvum sp.]